MAGGGGRGGAEEEDHFERLPDALLLLVFNKVADVKALGRCSLVSRRFHALVPLVDDLLVRVDCVLSDHDQQHPINPPATTSSSSCSLYHKPRRLLLSLLAGILRPLQAIAQILLAGPSGDASPSVAYKKPSTSEVSHHSPAEVLRGFKEIRRLRIELPTGELGLDDGVLLKWKADFGSTLDTCVILLASSVLPSSSSSSPPSPAPTDKSEGEDNLGGNMLPESFYANGSLKLRVVWTISSLIAASARHYLLHQIVAEHETLESLDLADAEGQGLLRMDRRQMEELRVNPVSASGMSQRTLVPALNMRLWYAHHLELPVGGVVLQGATLVAIRPTGVGGGGTDTSWVVASALEEEPYASAVRQLVKTRMYCLEMNSF